jgi:hypothetical protein
MQCEKCFIRKICKYEGIALCPVSASDIVVATSSASYNSRYMTALNVYQEYLGGDYRSRDWTFVDYIEERLNAEK